MFAEAAFWGFVGAAALIVGAEVAFAYRLSNRTIGFILALFLTTLE